MSDAAAAAAAATAGATALQRLKSSDPPLYLSPSEELSKAARLASEYLFSSLKPYTPKSPFSHLLVNGFDAEQIWQQIDLQTQPLISSLSRQVKKFEKNPEEIRMLFNLGEKDEKDDGNDVNTISNGDEKMENKEGFDGLEDVEMEGDYNDDDEEEEEGDADKGKEEDGGGGGVEDRFLKIKELEEYLEEDEAREYGLEKKEKKQGKRDGEKDDSDKEGDDDDDEDEEEEDDELGVMGIDLGEDDESGEELENARYEDFFGGKGKMGQKRKSKLLHGSDNLDMDEELSGESSDDEKNQSQKKQKLSTHEIELEKLRSTIEQMEKANLEPKTWTMQGEVTAAKRPKNSALEVDIDFEHNVRPAPVITEEVTASLEELIQKRILEGRFDDVQKRPTLPSKAPREVKELDENKSKKGLAEIYEEEYVKKSGLVSTALSISDQQKKEASMLFKELCLKLDALSHFHFTPKPVIEDMSIQANVPALAMEEIAPLAVSDAAMLAPEEVFTGKGDIKEETELTKAERKRRRAKKKRKFKAEAAKSMLNKAQQNSSQNRVNGNEE